MPPAKRIVIIAGLTLSLAGCGGERAQDAAVGPSLAAQPIGVPPAAFLQCRSCHTLEPGRNLIGPSLHGVVGRRAASDLRFVYSNALKASGLTWDEKTLDAWLAGPTKLVPGSKMIFTGMPDAGKRQEVIDYLAAQK